MDYVKVAQELGRAFEKGVSAIEYHKFTDKGFVKHRNLDENLSKEKFIAARTKYEGELRLLKDLFPYVAYITAPTDNDAYNVLQLHYATLREVEDQKLKKLGVQTNGLGLGFQVDSRVEDWINSFDQYEYFFKTVAEHIERAASKIMVHATTSIKQ